MRKREHEEREGEKRGERKRERGSQKKHNETTVNC